MYTPMQYSSRLVLHISDDRIITTAFYWMMNAVASDYVNVSWQYADRVSIRHSLVRLSRTNSLFGMSRRASK